MLCLKRVPFSGKRYRICEFWYRKVLGIREFSYREERGSYKVTTDSRMKPNLHTFLCDHQYLYLACMLLQN